MKIRLIFCCLGLIAFAAQLWPQQPAQNKPEPAKGGSYTATVYSVLVDVIATDNKDRHVNDLKPEDFVIYEDGVKQKIDSIEVQSQGLARVIQAADTSSRIATAPAPAAPRANLITFLMDYATTDYANQKYVREAAIKYIKEKMGPQDVVAIFSTGAGGGLRTLQGFTTDKKLLTAVLSKGEVSGSSYKAERALLTSEIARESQAGSASPGAAVSQAGGSGFTPAAAVAGGSTGSASARAMLAQRIEKSFTSLRSFIDAQLARPILTAIKSIALAEKDIPGRKTLVLFSEGFVVPPNVEATMRDAADAANKANLAIYTVDTKGLKTELTTTNEMESINAATGRSRTIGAGGESLFDRARQVGSDQNESTLRFLSVSTGGFLIRNTNDFEIGLQRINDDISTYYLLSYRPTNVEFDGKFREIRVEVTRPGVKVRARNGYFATPPGDSLLSPEQRSLFAQARSRKNAPTLPLVVTASRFFPGATAPAAVVTIEVPTDSLQFKEVATVFDDSIQIIGLVKDRNGTPVTTFGRPLPLQFNKSELDAVRGGFITHWETLMLDPGRYSIEVLVHEPGTGNAGYASKELLLDPPSKFELSDLVLSQRIAKVTADSQSDPLATADAKVLPSASRRFRNGDRLIFYFDIYNAKTNNSQPNIEVTLAVAKDGHAIPVKLPVYKIAQPVKGDAFRIQVAKYLELSGLAPGNYSLIVSARDQNAGSAGVAHSTFTIVN
ncbi:MAG TPA: VWA domain-containing protein [Acidobacteriota bacterium]|jgi:VWFA-related protein